MPETKRSDESNDSDSGPDDVAPPPKKSKVDKKPDKSKAKSSKGKDTEEPSWALDKKRFIKVREYSGKVMVDIREYYDKDGVLLPGRKGISLSLPQWNKIKDIMDEIDEAIAKK